MAKKRKGNQSMRRRKNDDSFMFWLMLIIIGSLAMPFVGIGFIIKAKPENKIYGILMIVWGLIAWGLVLFG